MKLTNNWYTTLGYDEQNQTIYAQIRTQLEQFKDSTKYPYFVEVTFSYTASKGGFPEGAEAAQIEAVDELLTRAMEKDKLAILTASFLLPSEKIWTFYSRSKDAFFDRLNETLADLPLLPLRFVVEEDPEWYNYQEAWELYDADEHALQEAPLD